MGAKHDVFLSHASADKTVADMACAVLEREGVRVWIAPRDVLAGADYPAQLTAAIEDAAVLVAVWSEHFDASEHTKREVEIAVSLGKHVLPLRIADVPMGPASRYLFAGKHWLDAITPPMAAHLAKLAVTVKALLGQGPPPRTRGANRGRIGARGATAVAIALLALVAWLLLRNRGEGGERTAMEESRAESAQPGTPPRAADDPGLRAFVERHAGPRHPFSLSHRRSDGERWGWQGDVRFTTSAEGALACEIRRLASEPRRVGLRLEGDAIVGATLRDFTGSESHEDAPLRLGIAAIPSHISVDAGLLGADVITASAEGWSLAILIAREATHWITMLPDAERNDEVCTDFDLPPVNGGLACFLQTRLGRGMAPIAELAAKSAFRFRGQFTVRDSGAGNWNGAVVTIDVEPGLAIDGPEFEHRIEKGHSTVDFDVYVPPGSRRVRWSIEESSGEVLWNALRLEPTEEVKLATEKVRDEPAVAAAAASESRLDRAGSWVGRSIPTVWMRRLGESRRAERRDWRFHSVNGERVQIATNPDRAQELVDATLREGTLEVPVPRYALDREFAGPLRFRTARLPDEISAGTLAGRFATLASDAPRASAWYLLDLEPGILLASSLRADLRLPNGDLAAIEGGRFGLDPFVGGEVQLPVAVPAKDQALTLHGSLCIADRYGRRARPGSSVTVSVDGVTRFSEVVGDRLRVDFTAEVPRGALHVTLVAKARSGESFMAIWNCVWLEPGR